MSKNNQWSSWWLIFFTFLSKMCCSSLNSTSWSKMFHKMANTLLHSLFSYSYLTETGTKKTGILFKVLIKQKADKLALSQLKRNVRKKRNWWQNNIFSYSSSRNAVNNENLEWCSFDCKASYVVILMIKYLY